MSTTFQSDVAPLRRVVVKHARDAFLSQVTIDAQWRALGYRDPPDLRRAEAEYNAFVDLLAGFGVELLFLRRVNGVGLDSIYARDAAVVTDRGVILCSMGKDARRGEPAAQESACQEWGVPILGSIDGGGLLEGGDVAWLDRRTLAVGRGYRTNDEGIRQLRRFLGGEIEVVEVALPHFRGPRDVFHLMSVISPIADDLAVVYSPLMPVAFRELLISRRMKLVEVPEEEYDTLGSNVLAIAPRVCLVPEGNPVTRRRLEAAGVEVHAFQAEEICLKGSGGPTCLTRPLEREA